MLRVEGGSPSLVYRPPRSRSLYEQVNLLQRIVLFRSSVAGLTWDEIAEIEGIPKRTLQHFYRSARDGAGVTGRRRRTRWL